MVQEFEGFIIEFIPNGDISLTFNLVCFMCCVKIVVLVCQMCAYLVMFYYCI